MVGVLEEKQRRHLRQTFVNTVERWERKIRQMGRTNEPNPICEPTVGCCGYSCYFG